MTGVAGALITVAVLSLLLPGARGYGIACLVFLCFFNPILAACLAITLVLYILK